ncbi:MAG TPA: hypothetical protein VLN59_07815 [Burkholderiales bacterium]|nr:hypothetical protein [Burkholderiales bacterium]
MSENLAHISTQGRLAGAAIPSIVGQSLLRNIDDSADELQKSILRIE